MKKIILILIVFLGSFAVSRADLGGFTINNYQANIDLQKNGSMNMAEKIDVNFNKERHGVYRYVPNVYPNGDNISISDFDAGEDPIASINLMNGNYEIRIGSKDQTIIGQHIYNISYKANNAIKSYLVGQSGEYSEFYRNVLGSKRDTSISGFKFTVNIPTDYKFSSGEIFLFYGKDKDKLTGDSYIYQSGSQIIGYINKELDPNIGATIGLKFPKNYFYFPSDYDIYFSQNKISENNTKYPDDYTFTQAKESFYQSYFYQTVLYYIYIGIFTFGRGANIILAFLYDRRNYKNNLITFVVLMRFTRIFGVFSYTFASDWGHDMFIFCIPFGLIGLGIILVRSVLIKKLIDYQKFGYWKSNKSITIYYSAPEDIPAPEAFYFWYFNKNEPKVFAALIYYRCSSGLTNLKKENDIYTLELLKRSNDMNELFEILFKSKDTYNLGQKDTSVIRILSRLEKDFKKEHENLYQKNKGFFNEKYTLRDDGEKVYEKIRGFREYLSEVEKPVLQKELENNQDFFNKIIPRAVLFGLETKIVEAAENILPQIDWYKSDDNSFLSNRIFKNITNNAIDSVIIPSSSGGNSSSGGFSTGSSSSGFSNSGGGGSSGGGGGGGGGGSW